MDYVDLLPLSLLFLLLIEIDSIRESNAINKDYLSIKNGNVLRGLFAIVVVFHHLAQRMESGTIFQCFKHVGYLAVSVFFFLSGYGLQKAFITSENYKKHFLSKRLSKIIIPYMIVVVIYWICYSIMGDALSLRSILESMMKGSPFVSNSWYIICICNFYIAFWIFMTMTKNQFDLMVFLAIIWYGFYVFYCRLLGYGAWWYNSTHLLVGGMYWAIHERDIIFFVKKYYTNVFSLVFIGFLFTYISGFMVDTWLSMILKMLSSVLFVVTVILISLKIKVKDGIFGILGSISMELYLIHGLVISVLRSDIIFIRNDFLWSCVVSVGSILSGWFLHQFFSKISRVLDSR